MTSYSIGSPERAYAPAQDLGTLVSDASIALDVLKALLTNKGSVMERATLEALAALVDNARNLKVPSSGEDGS
ncbi:MAG: hypothetical protein LBR80_17010 [Deltaproteobacteria bacterium]|jgi:hypothetical protein|nr:hypothetical protein [Deltaproteobacteria bacterium]